MENESETESEASVSVESADEKENESKDKSNSNENSSDLDALEDIDVQEELFDVTITIPADYIGNTSQEELDAEASEYGYKVVLNADGTATYTMTKSQHKEMLDGIAKDINSSLSEMVGSEEYPNITSIEANENFTEFTVTTSSTELDMNESFTTMAFCMYGGMYAIFSGETVDNIHVDFINSDTGEIINSSDSADMQF